MHIAAIKQSIAYLIVIPFFLICLYISAASTNVFEDIGIYIRFDKYFLVLEYCRSSLIPCRISVTTNPHMQMSSPSSIKDWNRDTCPRFLPAKKSIQTLYQPVSMLKPTFSHLFNIPFPLNTSFKL